MKNKFEKLKFNKSNAQFTDNRKMITGFVKGSFSREEISGKMQELANGIKASDRNAYIGVTLHYKNVNAWLPAVMTHVTGSVKIFNPSDSDTTHTYDDIDGAYFYVIEKPQGEVLTQKMHTIKGAKKPNVNNDGFLFGKK